MENLPNYIGIVFIFTTLLTIFLFYKATSQSWRTLIILIIWITIQAIVSLSGFYTKTDAIPPRFSFLLLPPLLLIIILFVSPKGRNYFDSLDIKALIILHIIRMPIEMGLHLLSNNHVIPELMTYEGRNFDIISGITAPFIFYFGFVKNILSNKIILLWNFICLGLLINIVVTAVLSVPSPIQKFGFDQPNIAVLYFPFVWLPCCIVPIVLISHLVVIRRLLFKNK